MTRAIKHVAGLALALPEPGGADDAIGSTDEYPFTPPPPSAPVQPSPQEAPLDPSLALPVMSSPQPVGVAPNRLPFPAPASLSTAQYNTLSDDKPLQYEPLGTAEEQQMRDNHLLAEIYEKHLRQLDPRLSSVAFRPGDRVNYRSIEEIRVALAYGYLELDFMSMGQNAHMTVREQDGGRAYTFAIRFVGNHTAMRPAEYKSLTSLCASIDLHAFCWYPNGSY